MTLIWSASKEVPGTDGTALLDKMVNNGLSINEKDRNMILEYLALHLSPEKRNRVENLEKLP